MIKIKIYIARNWLWIAAGIILTEVSVEAAYEQRGYLAYGGEYLTLPLLLMAVEFARETLDILKMLFWPMDECE